MLASIVVVKVKSCGQKVTVTRGEGSHQAEEGGLPGKVGWGVRQVSLGQEGKNPRGRRQFGEDLSAAPKEILVICQTAPEKETGPNPVCAKTGR